MDHYVASYHPSEPNTIRMVASFSDGGVSRTRISHVHSFRPLCKCEYNRPVLPVDHCYIGPPPTTADSNSNTPVGFLHAEKPEYAIPVKLTRGDGKDTGGIVLTSGGRWSLTEIAGQVKPETRWRVVGDPGWVGSCHVMGEVRGEQCIGKTKLTMYCCITNCGDPVPCPRNKRATKRVCDDPKFSNFAFLNDELDPLA